MLIAHPTILLNLHIQVSVVEYIIIIIRSKKNNLLKIVCIRMWYYTVYHKYVICQYVIVIVSNINYFPDYDLYHL